MPPAGAARCTGACAGSGSRHRVAGSGREPFCVCQFGIDHARQGVQGLVGACNSLAAQGPSGDRLSRCGQPAGCLARLAGAEQAGWGRRGVVVLLRGRCGPGGLTGHGQRCLGCGLVLGRSCLVLGGPGRGRGVAGPGVRLSGGSAVVPASARSMWASAVPMPRTRTGRQDTTVVIAHGARAIPAWASRW